MNEKVSALIGKVTVNSPVFQSEIFSPTLINYFFGKNGTGKSTIAKLIGKSETTEWHSGISPEDYELLVYNEEFIQENIQSYGNIPGVFTITKQNAAVKAEADKKTSELKALSDKKTTIGKKITENNGKLEKLFAKLVSALWEKSESIRKAYPGTQAGFTKSRQKFVTELLKYKPTSVDEDAIRDLYAVAYGEGGKPYEELKPVPASKIPSTPLLEQRPHCIFRFLECAECHSLGKPRT